MAIYAHWLETSKVPTLQWVLANVRAKHYGDDVLRTFSDTLHKYFSDFKFVSYVYSQYGFTLKDSPEKWRASLSLMGHSFLGMQIRKYRDYFVPYYSYDKVKDSAVVLKKEISLDIKRARFQALLGLLVFTPHYDEFKEFILNYFNEISADPPFLYAQRDLQAIELGLKW